MLSTIYRLTSLVMFAIVLTGFGSALRIKADTEGNEDSTGYNLKVSCLANAPKYSRQTVVMMQITRHGQDIPITTILARDKPKMEAHSKETMEVEGEIDNNSGESNLTLIVKTPSVDDAGLYRCRMLVRDHEHRINTESVTTRVNFDNQNIKAVLTSLKTQVSRMMTTVKEIRLVQNQTIKTLNEHKHNIDALNKQYIESQKPPTTEKVTTTTSTTTTASTTTPATTIPTTTTSAATTPSTSKSTVPMETTSPTTTTTPAKTITTSKTTVAALLSCPHLWSYYKADRTCLKVFGYNRKDDKFGRPLRWRRARKSCKALDKDQGDLVYIYDPEKQKFVDEMIDSSPADKAWIAINNGDKTSDTLQYANGSPLGDYQPFGSKANFSETRDWRCVVLSSETALWDTMKCNENHPYVCSISPSGVP